MSSLLPCAPNIVSAPFGNRTGFPLLNRPPSSYTLSGSTRNFLRGSLSVARFGFKPGFLPEPDGAGEVIRELFGRAEGLLYTIADAAVSNSDTAATTTAKQSNDWLSGITNYMETVLKVSLLLLFVSTSSSSIPLDLVSFMCEIESEIE